MPLFESLIAPALKSVTDLIGQFHMSPEEKLQAQQAIADAGAKAQQASMDYDAKLNDIAGQNIRAETGSTDKVTSRARPGFMYICEAVIAANYLIIPLASIFGSKVTPFNLPDNLMWLFGSCIMGYTMARTVDKTMALPGDSQINVAGLLKIGQKS